MGPGGGQGCCTPADTCTRGGRAPTHCTAPARTDGCQTLLPCLSAMVGAGLGFQHPAPCPELCQSQWIPRVGRRCSDMPMGTNRPMHGHGHEHAHVHGDMRTNKETGGCSSAEPGGEVCSHMMGSLPARLGQQHPNSGAWVQGACRLRAQQGPMCCPQPEDTHQAWHTKAQTGPTAGSICEEPVPGISCT